MINTKANAVSAPTPGCVCSRRASGHFSTSCSMACVSSAIVGVRRSNCRWTFPVPTLLSGEEAKGAYDRLAAVKFREHKCEAMSVLSAENQEPKWDAAKEKARADAEH